MEPLYIFDINEWYKDKYGLRKLPRYIVAIFPDDIDISKIKFTKESKKYYKCELQIAKLNQFTKIVELNNKGMKHYKDKYGVYTWSSLPLDSAHYKITYTETVKGKNESAKEPEIIIGLGQNTNIITLSDPNLESKSIYILDVKCNKNPPFIAAICGKRIDSACISFSEETIKHFNNRECKVVSGPIWDRVVSLCKRKMYRAIDGKDCYMWRELPCREKVYIRLIVTGKERKYIQRAIQNQNWIQKQKEKQIQSPKIKTVFSLEMVLYVCVYYPYKYLQGCKIESVHAGLLCIDGQIRYIEAHYCEEKNCCFVSYYDYQAFQSQYGFILTKVYRVKNDSWNAILGHESSFNEQSELNLHGYNVGKKDNLTTQERHDILAALLDYGIMNRYSIELYLEQFINLNGAKSNMEDACAKWRNDYDFVLHYEIKDQRSVLIKQIQSRSKNIIVGEP